MSKEIAAAIKEIFNPYSSGLGEVIKDALDPSVPNRRGEPSLASALVKAVSGLRLEAPAGAPVMIRISARQTINPREIAYIEAGEDMAGGFVRILMVSGRAKSVRAPDFDAACKIARAIEGAAGFKMVTLDGVDGLVTRLNGAGEGTKVVPDGSGGRKVVKC